MVKQNEAAGFSLLSMMVAISISGFLVHALMHYTSNTLRAAKMHQIQSDYELIRQTLRSRVSCPQTVAPRPTVACDDAPGGMVDVRSVGGSIVVSANAADPVNWLGSYQLRATCQPHPPGDPTQRAIVLEARATVGPGNTLPLGHPLLAGTPMAWSELFQVPLCIAP